MKQKTNYFLTAVMAIVALITIGIPLYITIIIALKSPTDMINPISFPKAFHFSNFLDAMDKTNYFSVLLNSVKITVSVLILTLLTNSIVGYAIARNRNKKFFNGIYYYFLSAMFIPFPIIMLPLVKELNGLHMDNLPGLIILYVIYGLPQNIFLYTGYIKSIPFSLEEAAIIDGASTFQVFTKVIFPLLKPINATVAIMTSLWTWNDFMLPLIILQDPGSQTLPLVQYTFMSQFSTNYNLAFASYLLALAPMVIVYLFLQKWIVNGVVAGSVKQ